MTDLSVGWLIGFAHFGSRTALVGETTQKLPLLDCWHMCASVKMDQSSFNHQQLQTLRPKVSNSWSFLLAWRPPTRPLTKQHWFKRVYWRQQKYSNFFWPCCLSLSLPWPSGWDKEQQGAEARVDQPTPWRHHHHHDLTHKHAHRERLMAGLDRVKVKCFN